MSDSSAFVKAESLTRADREGRGQGAPALYFRLFGSLRLFLTLLPLTLLLILLASAAPSFFRWYAGEFASGAGSRWVKELGFDLRFTVTGVGIVTSAAIGTRIFAWILFEVTGMWSSQGIHRRMMSSMSGTRTTFFDENPSGRLINRLVRDYDELRSTAIIFVGDSLNAMIEVLSVSVLAFFANPVAGALVFPLFGIFFYIQYQRSGMLDHARNFSAVSTSHVLSRKNDLIEGRQIYLLYGRSEKLMRRIGQSFTDYVRAGVLISQIEAWGSFWMRLSAECFSFCVLIFLSYAITHGTVSPTLGGVIISALFGITGSIGWLDFATGFMSRSTPHIRRVFEFVDLEPEEKSERRSLPSRDMRPEAENDAHLFTGSAKFLEFSGYSMAYRKDTPKILEKLDLRLPLGKKIALVGRTGSGKTSLFQSLLRMVHVYEGEIFLGGVSTSGYDLRELRKLFGVVPQFPYLFAGSIRSNLDRTGAISPEVLERAMEAVGLNIRLDHSVSEGGGNLSLGERQLVCLARVIAAKRPIILMDEPTSGLDPETDARVQKVLETALADRTVLTIAHRMESVARYDEVVEMRAGRVVWQGPAEHWLATQPLMPTT